MLWKTLRYGDSYEISECGYVRRTKTTCINKHLKGTLLRQHSNGKKYRFVVVTIKPGTYKRFYVHRLVAEHFIGSAPTDKHEVAHWDGDPTNNHFSNLRWATRSENHHDRRRHETLPGQRLYGARAWAES